MKTLISPLSCARIAAFLLTAAVLFHIAVMAGLVPPDIVWGGRLPESASLLEMELVSVFLNLSMLVVVLAYLGLFVLKPWFLRMAFAGMAVIFFLNTLGNLAAVNRLETILFAPLTFVLMLCFARLAFSGFKK